MRRREFITALTGVALAWPVEGHAQQQPSKTHRIALVHPSNPTSEMSETGGHSGYKALFQELRRLGYVEGRNLRVDRYSADGRLDRFAELARDVVNTKQRRRQRGADGKARRGL
jgi:putative ABC transport system substrate-binding protein